MGWKRTFIVILRWINSLVSFISFRLMNLMKQTRTFITIATLIIILILSILVSLVNFWIGLSSFLVLTILFVITGVKEIEALPPHKAVLLFLGKRQKVILGEGWCFLPFYPLIFNVIQINVTKYNQDLPAQLVRTPDLAELKIKTSITWTPGIYESAGGEKKYNPDSFIQFLNSGGGIGVVSILSDIIESRLRTWTISEQEGPSTWQEAMKARDDATAILIKTILGSDLEAVPSSIPTNVLLKWFAVPRRPLSENEKLWGKKSENGSEWEGVEIEFNKLSEDEREKLKRVVEERQKIITELMKGDGYFKQTSLGITVNRFNITEIKVVGAVAEAAELQKKEIHERDAEQVEIEGIIARVKSLKSDLGISAEQAIELLQTERTKKEGASSKVSKTIREEKISVSPETRGTLEKIAEFFKKT